MFGLEGSNLDLNKLLKSKDISPQVQQHLQRTYATLGAGVAMAVFGTCAHLYFHIGGYMTAVSFLFFLPRMRSMFESVHFVVSTLSVSS